jgi:hypothetical protein
VSMTPSLFSIESLAVELGRDRRTIAKALRDVTPDGKIGSRPAWRLQTALKAMKRREGIAAGDEQATIEEIEGFPAS